MSKVDFSTTGKEESYTTWWMEQQKDSHDETVEIGDIQIFVSQGVFSPKKEITNSVDLILRNFPDVRGKRVLDIGTGTGILAITAAREGAREVVATDVTEAALENARRNIESTGTSAVITLSNEEKFEEIPGPFDVIIMNIIFAHSPEDPETKERIRIESLGLHRRLVNALPNLLAPDGAVILGFASFGDIETLSEILNGSALKTRVITERKFDVNWYVIEARF